MFTSFILNENSFRLSKKKKKNFLSLQQILISNNIQYNNNMHSSDEKRTLFLQIGTMHIYMYINKVAILLPFLHLLVKI